MKDGKGRYSGEVLPNTGEIKEQSALMLAKKSRLGMCYQVSSEKKVKIKTKQNTGGVLRTT